MSKMEDFDPALQDGRGDRVVPKPAGRSDSGPDDGGSADQDDSDPRLPAGRRDGPSSEPPK